MSLLRDRQVTDQTSPLQLADALVKCASSSVIIRIHFKLTYPSPLRQALYDLLLPHWNLRSLRSIAQLEHRQKRIRPECEAGTVTHLDTETIMVDGISSLIHTK